MVEIATENIGKLVMTNMTDRDITIKNVTTSNTIKVNLKSGMVIPAKQEFQIVATIIPAMSGNYLGEISFTTDDDENSNVKLYVSGQVLAPASGQGE